jgi:ankyrin repeat protein
MKPKLLLGLALVLSIVAVYGAILFISKPTPTDKIFGAAMSGNLDLLKEQEAKGGSLDAQHPRTFGWNPLMAAIYHQQTNIIQYLLTQNLNLNVQDTSGRTALMWAITVDDTNTVRLLLEKGADVTINGKAGDAFSYANVIDGNARAHRELYLEWLNAYKDKNKSSAKP